MSAITVKPALLFISALFLSSTPLSANPQAILSSGQSDPASYLSAAKVLLANSPSAESLTLISKRAAALFDSAAPPAVEHVLHLNAACELVLLLHRADPKFALPVLRKHTPDCLAASKIGGSAGHRFLSFAGAFCQLRFESGKDPAALDDYIALLPSAEPDSFTQLPSVLRFLLSYPDEPKLADLAETLFNGDIGNWNPIVGLTGRYYSGYSSRDIYRDPLLWKHPAFQRQLARLLSDTSPVGEITIIDSTAYAISINEGWTDSFTDPAFEGHLPTPRKKFPLRVCDFHALHAARQSDAPEFHPFWPTDKKDAALRKLRKFYEAPTSL